MSKSDTPRDWLTEPYAYHCDEHGWWDAKRESGCPSCVVDARLKIALLERRCAKLEKDAARYKWVRANMEECETLFKEWLSQPAYEEAARALDTTADAFLAAQEPSK